MRIGYGVIQANSLRILPVISIAQQGECRGDRSESTFHDCPGAIIELRFFHDNHQ